MKLLHNPIVVAVLAVLALGYSGWTILGSRSLRSFAAAQAPTTANGPTPAATPANQQPASRQKPPSPNLRPIQRDAILADARRWLESPRRDPFRILNPSAPTPVGPPAAELLSLQAIWRQTGSELAIINQHILREGDHFNGFDLETIEPDAVWVRGTNGNGRERLIFAGPNDPAGGASHPTAAPRPTLTTSTATAKIPVAPRP